MVNGLAIKRFIDAHDNPKDNIVFVNFCKMCHQKVIVPLPVKV